MARRGRLRLGRHSGCLRCGGPGPARDRGVVGGVATFALVTVGWGLFVMPVDRFMLMLGRFM